MNARHMIASYLIVQAAGTAAWWALLVLVPESVSWFKPSVFPAEALLGFWLGDAVLLIVGSLAAAWAVLRKRSWAGISVWALAASVWYPTLYCSGVSTATAIALTSACKERRGMPFKLLRPKALTGRS